MASSSLNELEVALQPLVERLGFQEEFRLDAYLSADRLLDAVKLLYDMGWTHLSAITGMDMPKPGPVSAGAPASQNPTALREQPDADNQDSAESRIELLYHFYEGKANITLRTSVPYSHPVAPSVCGLLPYATLYEREVIEMFGVELEGTPETSRFVLPDDWPQGVYPMRKDY